MKILTKIIPLAVSFFFILLFIYAAASKMLDFENFQVQLAQSPLLSAYAGLISYAVIMLEIVVAGLLCFQVTRLIGLYASFALMVAFTVYIYLILHFSDFVPCSCGGILEKMSWQQHLVFNIISVLLAFIGISFIRKDRAHRWSHTAAWLAFSAALSTGSMVALFLSSEYIIKKENNFTRRFPSHILTEEKFISLDTDSYYFAGITDKELFLGNKSTPFNIFKVANDLSKIDRVKTFPQGNFRFKNLIYEVIDNKIYAHDGTIPLIYKGINRESEIMLSPVSYDNAYFNQLTVIDSTTFAIRSNEARSALNIFGTIDLKRKIKFQRSKELLAANNNIFDSDGKLLYDRKIERIIYTHFYRNQIWILNREMQLTFVGKTIDTVSQSGIKFHKFPDGTLKMSAPPKMLNLAMTTHNGLLFIRSMLRGKYEPGETWKSSSIIDVYEIHPFKYWGSFYVQNRGGKSVSQMLVTNDHLFVLIGNHLVKYRLKKSVFDEAKRGKPKNRSSE